MTLVKICGNRTPADVLAAAEAGADFVGMVFAAVLAPRGRRRGAGDGARARPPARTSTRWPSRRPSQPHVRERVERLVPPRRAGARVAPAAQAPAHRRRLRRPADRARSTRSPSEAGVDLVQLSGDESWEDCLLVARPVIQVVHVSPLDSALRPDGTRASPASRSRSCSTPRTASIEVAAAAPSTGTSRSERRRRRCRCCSRAASPRRTSARRSRACTRGPSMSSSGTETDGRKDHDARARFIEAVRAA